jgi:phosphatidate cytidylyltransferase
VNELGLRICSSLVLAAIAIAATWAGGLVYLLLWLVAALLILWEWARMSAFRPAWLVGGLVYAAIFFAAMMLLRNEPHGRTAIFWLFGIIWAADSAAYFGGRLIGGPKLWPAVSPGKTWSGAIVGTIAGVLGGLLVIVAAGIQPHAMHIVLGMIVVIAAQLGDLLESGIKRHFGVKDSGNLIPGHGGVMDRCDSLVAASSVALLLGALRVLHAPTQGLLAW